MIESALISPRPAVKYLELDNQLHLSGCLQWWERHFARELRDVITQLELLKLSAVCIHMTQVHTLDLQCEFQLRRFIIALTAVESKQVTMVLPLRRGWVNRIINGINASNLKLVFQE